MSEVVRRRCRNSGGDERSLRVALLEDLRSLVPFDFHVWVLVDPCSEVAMSPLATVPDPLLSELSRVIGCRYLTRLHRWDTMSTSVESLDRATGGQRDGSRLHREMLGPAGIGDVASVIFRDDHGCWGFLDLWRSAPRPSFSEREIGLLADDVGAITVALRRTQARAFDDTLAGDEPSGPAVLFLSRELDVLGQTPGSDAYLRALLPTDADREPVPANAFNVAAALLASEAGCFDHPPIAHARPNDGALLTFHAARVDADRPPPERDIAVTITASTPAERRSLYVRAHSLSHREIEVVDLLAGGADTRTIATSLFLSEHTVQDHLKSIFDKTGARNRRTLLARLSGR